MIPTEPLMKMMMFGQTLKPTISSLDNLKIPVQNGQYGKLDGNIKGNLKAFRPRNTSGSAVEPCSSMKHAC